MMNDEGTLFLSLQINFPFDINMNIDWFRGVRCQGSSEESDELNTSSDLDRFWTSIV